MQGGKGIAVYAYCDMCEEPIYVGGLYFSHWGECICEACVDSHMKLADDATAMNEPDTVDEWARDIGAAYLR